MRADTFIMVFVALASAMIGLCLYVLGVPQ